MHPRYCLLPLLMLLSSWSNLLSAQPYCTKSHHELIKTLLVHPVNDWKASPVIRLRTEDQLSISFDELSHDYKRLAYRLIHCNKNWEPSDLVVMEYQEGFTENDLATYEQSVSTNTLYTHYTLLLPNADVKLTVSGNYACQIFDKDDPETILLTACFMVVETKVSIKSDITASTDIDTEDQHQQLRYEITPRGFQFQDPLAEIHLNIRQNRRLDNQVKGLQPQEVSPTRLIYEHDKALIFLAGNEYRRFETTTFKRAGLGVDRVAFHRPYYNVELVECLPRTTGYTYDQDQNGRYLIHTIDNTPDETTADYFLVHFTYPTQTPSLEEGLYLQGDLVNSHFDDGNKFVYNFERKAYEKTLLLKQGSYNYQLLFKPSGRGSASPLKTEGSYWQTENEYQVYVYYRPLGGRYDQLIGFNELKTTF